MLPQRPSGQRQHSGAHQDVIRIKGGDGKDTDACFSQRVEYAGENARG